MCLSKGAFVEALSKTMKCQKLFVCLNNVVGGKTRFDFETKIKSTYFSASFRSFIVVKLTFDYLIEFLEKFLFRLTIGVRVAQF